MSAIQNAAKRRVLAIDFKDGARLDTSQVRDMRKAPKVKAKGIDRDDLRRRVERLLLEKKYKANRDYNRTGR